MRWHKPVFPGDTLRCEGEVLEARVSRSKPAIGIVRTKLTLFNQDDAAVMSQISNIVVQRKSG